MPTSAGGRASSDSPADVLGFDFVGLPQGSALQERREGHAARAGRTLKLRVQLPGFEAICRTVETGVGIAVASRTAAVRCRKSMAIRLVPLADPWALRHLRLS